MKKLIFGTLIAISTAGICQEEKNHKHRISPKVFYRHHEEKNYTYKVCGMGVEYSLFRPRGINVKISSIYNPQNAKRLYEAENVLSYRIPVKENQCIYPIFSNKYSHHEVNHEKYDHFTINKSTTHLGVGWELFAKDLFLMHVETQFFQDIHNSCMVFQGDDFWGRSYSNPAGFRGKAGVRSSWNKKGFLCLEGYFAKTFSKCYKEMGLEFSLNWSI